ncbi:MAG: DUF4760 domain-containing protein [Lachnospiraceae bacterium]|nr:DUF4760 domain-containing protein [Lachnospiraceae bacterium]
MIIIGSVSGCIINFEDLLKITADLAVILGGLFALYQYCKQKKLNRIRDAIDIAKYFATDIVDMAGFICAMFHGDSCIHGIIEKHLEDIKNAKYFTRQKYFDMFTDEERKMYDDFLKTKIDIGGGKHVHLGRMIQDVTNELEHCSIRFNSGLADDKAVYQSMHQVIFELFPCIYPYISRINENTTDQYYTNLCELYLRWNKIREKSIKKETKEQRKLQRYTERHSRKGAVRTPKI